MMTAGWLLLIMILSPSLPFVTGPEPTLPTCALFGRLNGVFGFGIMAAGRGRS
jgi:hypothetical protein